MKKLIWLIILFPILFAGVSLDGVDDYVKVAATGVADFEPTKKLSISMWVKRTGACENYASLFAKAINNGTTTPYHSWVLQCNGASDTDYIVYITCGTRVHTSAITLLPNTTDWVHLAVTFDRDGGDQPIIIIYKNGASVLNETLVNTGNITYEADANEGDVFFGAEGTSGTYSGAYQYSEISYWKDIVLTPAEVGVLYSSRLKRMPLQIQSSSLKLYLPMLDEIDGSSADGDTFQDESGNGNNGTGDDGAGNDNCTAKAEEVLSYPGD